VYKEMVESSDDPSPQGKKKLKDVSEKAPAQMNASVVFN